MLYVDVCNMLMYVVNVVKILSLMCTLVFLVFSRATKPHGIFYLLFPAS